MENMVTYPSHLPPKEHYQYIRDNNWIRFLTVFTFSKDNKDSITGDVHPKSFCDPSKHIEDFSTNLLGIFAPMDNYVAIKKGPNKVYFTAQWQEGEEVQVPLYPNDFEFDYSRGYFFLDAFEFVGKIPVKYEKENQSYKAWPRVIHTPTRANFWHVSIRWVDEQNQEIRASKSVKGWKRNLYKKAKDKIIENARFEEPSYEAIPQEVYQQ